VRANPRLPIYVYEQVAKDMKECKDASFSREAAIALIKDYDRQHKWEKRPVPPHRWRVLAPVALWFESALWWLWRKFRDWREELTRKEKWEEIT